jgi:methionyl-tRNA synthetase
LTSNAPETKDNDFTWKISRRNNNELVCYYGNFINRVVVLTKYYEGIVPSANTLSEVDEATLTELKALLPL